ncbi:rhodanese-like domain-containing protein [Alkalimarinus sediminis]|uniref:Rhodanese-like domain-containing protein n=1 Tax=Alkalimarinus sediminis TaxID=1632866 RepID=A0A9E8HS33_9ALTE|nr:rhodanese-like domain-containing protein [Alkalimarinus sediminis]UZW74759.1 rhodanese-like domain-containing protein [Alkalimarinus sediminis]
MVQSPQSQYGIYQIVSFLLLSIVSLGLSANVTTIPQQTLLDNIANNTPMLILDVRTPEEYAAGHVPNAVNIPHTEIKQQASLIAQAASEGKQIVVYCRSGRRAGYAERVLQSSGIKALQHLEGDMNAWTQNRHPIEQ